MKRDWDAFQAEYRRKWEHFDRQERRRLMRGISPLQLFRHRAIESTMWEENSTSSEEPEGDGIDPDGAAYLENMTGDNRRQTPSFPDI
jgi:hypothetical protein